VKWLGSICKLFSTTLAKLLLFHIASYLPYDYYCLFFFYLLDNLITLCLEMEEQKICKDFVRVVLLLLLIVPSRSSSFSSWHDFTIALMTTIQVECGINQTSPDKLDIDSIVCLSLQHE